MDRIDKKIFKAYDIRGKYPTEVNEANMALVGRSLAGYFDKGLLVVGHDARVSSPSLYKTVVSAVRKKGLKVLPVGMLTTPMLYFLVAKLRASGGLMITASHNPPEYNGLKMVRAGAVPISGEEAYKIITAKLA